MSDSDIIRTLAEKCMGWTLATMRDAHGLGVIVQYPDGFYRNNANGTRTRFDPLHSISEAFIVLDNGEWDYVIRKERGTGNFSVWIINSAWVYKNPGKLPNIDSLDLYGRAVDANLARAICLAAIAALEEL